MRLNIYANNVTSQNGEDGIIQYIIKNLSSIPKVCLDIGAWDGKFLSNTYSLWHDSDWKGILIEADKEKFKSIRKSYSTFDILVFNQFITPRGKNSIDSLFKVNKIDPKIGLISIDIDSHDYHLWKHMEYVRPVIVVIEHNPTIPAYVEYHDPEDEVYLLCSAKSLEKLGREKGYRLICCTSLNCIFIKDEFFNGNVFPDMPVEYFFDYSNCSALELYTMQGPEYVQSPAFYKKPRKLQVIYSVFRYIFEPIFQRKKRKRPSKSLREHCKKFGIHIY